MISRGIEIAANGMKSLIDFQDTIAHNLANVNTTGYKKESLSFRSVYNAMVSEPEKLNDYKYRTGRDVGRVSMGSESNKLVHEFIQGALVKTGLPLDLAIEGDGLFKVQNSKGEIAYTRNGSFTIDSRHRLINHEGELVLDVEDKPIVLNIRALGVSTANELTVNEDGQIGIAKAEGSRLLQKIAIYDFSNKEDMLALGHAKYYPKDLEMNPVLKAEKFTLQQGYLEASNSNVVNEMINSINVSRNYETLSKFVKEKASHITAAINIGRLRQ